MIFLIGVFFLVNFYVELIGSTDTFTDALPHMILILVYPILISSIFILLVKKGSLIAGVMFSGIGIFHVTHEYANYQRIIRISEERGNQILQNAIESQLILYGVLVIFGIVLICCGIYLTIKKIKKKE